MSVFAENSTGIGHYLSDRAVAAQPSEVRKILRASPRPGIISFANGAPYLGALPFDQLADEAHRILSQNGTRAFQYGPSEGVAELRRHICGLMSLEGITADPADVVVTAGSQQAIDVAARVVVNPGDVIFAEGPSYAGGMAAFTGYEAEIVHVPTDADGMMVDELERSLARVRAEGKTPKGVYTIPNFQNPGGVNLSAERRIRIGQLCRSEGMLVFEDNPYGLLGFDGTTTRAIQPDFADITIYFGSFSKMIAPGPRVGWMLPPSWLHEHMVNTSETSALNPAVFNQQLISAYMDNPAWKTKLDEYRGIYRRKMEALVATLEEVMPEGTTWNQPTGGFYLWVRVPDGIDTEKLVYEAIDRGVVYVPGTAFYTDGGGHHELRLSFCLPSEEDIRRGARIIGELFQAAA